MSDPGVLQYGSQDPRWLVECAQSAEMLELRHPQRPLLTTLLAKPRDVIVLIAAPFFIVALVVISIAVGMAQDFVGFILMSAAALGSCMCIAGVLAEVYYRWRRPSLVRVQGASLTIYRPAWNPQATHVLDLREVVVVASVLGSKKYHAMCSVVIALRDDSRITFLHCRNRLEAEWIARLLQYRVDQAKAAVGAG